MASESDSNDDKADKADKADHADRADRADKADAAATAASAAKSDDEEGRKPASLPPAPTMGDDAPPPKATATAAKSADATEPTAGDASTAAVAKTEAEAPPAKPVKAAAPPPKAAAPPPSDAAPLKPAEIAGIFAVLAIIGVGLYFLLRSPEAPSAKGRGNEPAERQDKTFAVGKTVDVELTLLPDDKKNVACASAKEVNGKHCEFEAQAKAWPAADGPTDESKLLKPYATTGQLRLLASGMWDDEAFVKSLPASRFRAKCKYKLEGKLGAPDIRWNPNGPWRPQRAEWWVGHLSGCKVL